MCGTVCVCECVCLCLCVCEREREKERERETDRQTDRQTETQTDRQTDRDTERELKPWSKHRTARIDPTGSDSSAMLRSPYLAGSVSLAVLFAIRACLTADDRRRKTKPTGYMFQCKYSKRRDTKERK